MLFSGVAIGVNAVSLPKMLTIDQPFYLWVERPGVTTPILYAYLDQENWRDPGGLLM